MLFFIVVAPLASTIFNKYFPVLSFFYLYNNFLS
jgi:hypothetical protein